MEMISLICQWNDYIQYKIDYILDKYDFPLFIRLLANKQQFWFACLWMSTFTEQFLMENNKKDLFLFFKKADHIIRSMPDLFNEKLYMQAHGLLWKYGFKKFFMNIHHAIFILNVLNEQIDRSNH